MNPPTPDPSTASQALPVKAVPLPLRVAAAARLITADVPDPIQAGRRMLASAEAMGIDLSNMWATITADAGQVGQVCLAVPGAGRTVMMFLSGPRTHGDGPTDAQERIDTLNAACTGIAHRLGQRAALAQALPELDEQWSRSALEGAGFLLIAELAYLKRAVRAPAPPPPLPEGVTMEPMLTIDRQGRQRLAACLAESYIDTLDCPDLCGLREVEDVIDSHQAAGVWTPGLWWLIVEGGKDRGCVLTNPSGETAPKAGGGASAELVYIGLSPELRGRGIARPALEHALAELFRVGVRSLTCAVDQRNTPALKLYGTLGFREFASRVAYVRKLG